MSNSYRDKDRIKSKAANAKIMHALNNDSSDLAELRAEANSIKEVKRFGNKRKAMAKEKVQGRRSEKAHARQELNKTLRDNQ